MSRKALVILLCASLAVNVFLIGAVVGGLVVGQKFRHERPMVARGGPPLWAAASELPPEKRRAYRRLLRGEAGEVRAGLAEVRAARQAAWRGLEAEPFDAAAVKRNLEAARMREAQVRGGVESRIVDFASTLPPGERARLAKSLAQGHPGKGRQMRERQDDRSTAP